MTPCEQILATIYELVGEVKSLESDCSRDFSRRHTFYASMLKNIFHLDKYLRSLFLCPIYKFSSGYLSWEYPSQFTECTNMWKKIMTPHL